MKTGFRFILCAGVVLYGFWGATLGVAGEEDAPSPSPTVAEQAAVAPESANPADNRFAVYQYLPEDSKILPTELTLSNYSKEIAGKVYYELKEEGGGRLTDKVAVVSAVPLSDFKRETEFGRLMAEYLMTDLADRGLQVTELRLGKEITILPQSGEFIMTRNIGELANAEPALDYVVVSTFSNTRKALIVQGRLVSLKTGVVTTSWRFSMPMNRELVSLFRDASEKPFTIAVRGFE